MTAAKNQSNVIRFPGAKPSLSDKRISCTQFQSVRQCLAKRDLSGVKRNLKEIDLPSHHLTQFYNGEVCRHSGNYALAISEYNKSIDQLPGQVSTLYARGLCYLELDHLDYALADFKMCAIFSKQDDRFHLQMSRVYQEMGLNRKSLASLEQAIEINPNNLQTIYARGIIKEALSDLSGANKDLDFCVNRDPSCFHFRLARGDLHLKQHHYSAAIADYQSILRDHANSSIVHAQLARCYCITGQVEQGFKHFTKAILLDPRNTSALYWFGYFLSKTGQTEKASSCFERVLEHKPQHRDSICALINLLVDSDNGDFYDLDRACQLAREVSPENADVPLEHLLTNAKKKSQQCRHDEAILLILEAISRNEGELSHDYYDSLDEFQYLNRYANLSSI